MARTKKKTKSHARAGANPTRQTKKKVTKSYSKARAKPKTSRSTPRKAASKEPDVERYWREARMGRIAPISNEMVRNFIAEHVLELPRSY